MSADAAVVSWEPTEDDLHWTREQLDALAVDDLWNTGELQYQRTGESELTLLSRTQRAAEAHERVKMVLTSLDWGCADDSVIVTPDDPMMQLQQAQTLAREWECPDEACGNLLVDCDLGGVEWVNHGEHPALGPEGEEMMAERWLVHVACSKCDSEIRMNPLDYGLLAGDDLFYTYRTAKRRYNVLSRDDVITLIDAGDTGVPLGSKDLDGAPLPPHMQGTFCVTNTLDSEEE